MNADGLKAALLVSTGLMACSNGGANRTGQSASADQSSCQPGATLVGASYDVSKSRFAFGSTPTVQDAGSLVRWVGSDGVVGISSNGFELGILNASAPEANLPDWSADGTTLVAHVSAYFESMGVASCQIANAYITASAGGGGSIDGGFIVTSASSQANLARGVAGIPVAESLAWARFDDNDQSTAEGFYWPTVNAAVVTAARALRDQLASPSGLAAYKSKLPSDAQGDGQVVIHHSSGASMNAFQAAATYDVLPPPTQFGFGTLLSFDPNGNPVSTAW